MDAQANKQVIMDGFEEFENGDLPHMMERFHDDAEWISPESESVPFAGSFHGKSGIERFFAELVASTEPIRFVPTNFIAEDDKVVVTGEATWRVRATGAHYDSLWVNVFTLRDGKVVRTDAYYDSAPVERAFRPVQPAQARAPGLRH